MPSGHVPQNFESKVIVLAKDFDSSDPGELLSKIHDATQAQLRNDRAATVTGISINVAYRPQLEWSTKADGTTDYKLDIGLVATATLMYENPANENDPFQDDSEVIAC